VAVSAENGSGGFFKVEFISLLAVSFEDPLCPWVNVKTTVALQSLALSESSSLT
jgi:hypothetical protein